MVYKTTWSLLAHQARRFLAHLGSSESPQRANSKNAKLLKDRAFRARGQNALDLALECFTQLEKAEPHDGQWPLRAADVHRRRGEYPLAVSALERAAEKYREQGFFHKASAARQLIQRMEPRCRAARTPKSELGSVGLMTQPGGSTTLA